jgi:selenocysteine lyase/cysteine desulfurase
MLAPFLAHSTQIKFYDICHTESTESTEKICHTEGTDDTDILYVTNYFGYENTQPIETVKKFKEKGAIILYDRTHSFLMENDPYLDLADYSFASIRKWMGVVDGAVVNGVSDCQLKQCPYLTSKETAMRMKKAFIEGNGSIDKQTFLNLYSEFGHHLAEDYQNYEMDDLSYAIYKTEDLSAMRRKRRENAKYLHENLKGVKFIGELTENAVPLFVPIFFETTEQRNAVRKKLIEAQIYCPIHWPKPTLIPADYEANKIYETELSLICDQRYNIEDMKRIVTFINEQGFR